MTDIIMYPIAVNNADNSQQGSVAFVPLALYSRSHARLSFAKAHKRKSE